MKKLRFILLLACSLSAVTSLFAQNIPTKDKKVFLGVNLGVGAGKIKMDNPSLIYINGVASCNTEYKNKLDQFVLGKVGLDFAYSLDEFHNDISIGAYTAYGTDSRNQIDYFDLGALMLFNLEDKASSLIMGCGTHMVDFKIYGLNLRAGVLFPRNIYMMLEYNRNTNVDESCSSPHDHRINSFVISFGYRIL